MKILLDECVDVEFRNYIAGHDVFTVSYMGWKGSKNGELLALAVGQGFEALVSTDRGVQYEQHLASLPIAVVILRAPTSQLEDLLPLTPALLTALNHAQPRTVTQVE